MKQVVKFFCFFSLFALLSVSHAEAVGTPPYQRMKPDCEPCAKIDELLAKHSRSTPEEQRDLVFDIAAVTDKINLRGKSVEDQRREIYFAIKATAEVLDDDFDAENPSNLLLLRAQNPQEFDYVFWRFPIGVQRAIISRMKELQGMGILVGKKPPVAKAVDP